MIELFRLIFEINFFIFPISAGILTYKKIHGKPAGRFFRMTIMSFIWLIISWIGVFVNETPEHKQEFINSIEQSLVGSEQGVGGSE